MPHSRQYVEHATSINGKPWTAPHPYIIGVKTVWAPFTWDPDDRGKITDRRRLAIGPDLAPVRLVCVTDHYAGERADHPWDPGDGWPAMRAAALWVPDGGEEAGRLRAIVEYLATVTVPPAEGPVLLADRIGETQAGWVFDHRERIAAVAAELLRDRGLRLR